MGQYYRWYITENKNAFKDLGQGDGLKLLEASGVRDTTVTEILFNLKDKPRKIAFIGDYWRDYLKSEDSSSNLIEKMKKNLRGLQQLKNASRYAPIGWRGLKQERLNTMLDYDEDLTPLYLALGYTFEKTKIYNHDRKEKINLPNSKLSQDNNKNRNFLMINHPLTILCAVGNGMGMGDFDKRFGANKPELAGLWAFESIEVSSKEDYCLDYVDKTKEYSFSTH